MTGPLSMIGEDEAWHAFERRDRAFDGRFLVGVRTTGIYCRPSCAARRPKRENVVFYDEAASARAAGLRACRRCLPDDTARDAEAAAAAVALIAASDTPPSLASLAARVGYSPHHFQRVFTRIVGVSPAIYARGLRAERAGAALSEEETVTDAIYAAGYEAPSRFYADAAPRLGMAPATWARGGSGETIRWTIADTSLGQLLVAATPRGLCRLAFDEDETALAERFPLATIEQGGADLAALATKVVAQVENPERDQALPLDARGSAFQQAVWAALRTIPAGETRSYAELAAAAGAPGAVRAAGSACGANPLAVVVPCHRVTRAGGGIGGYAYGVERKRVLLAREGVATA